MQQVRGSMSLVRDRFQWGSYGFVAGIVLGLILGWLFHGVVGTVLRLLLVALLLVPLFAAFLIWRRFSNRGKRDDVVEGRSFVIETRTDERERR